MIQTTNQDNYGGSFWSELGDHLDNSYQFTTLGQLWVIEGDDSPHHHRHNLHLCGGVGHKSRNRISHYTLVMTNIANWKITMLLIENPLIL